ncbi:MAG: phosphogluconate dehydrogenase (NAD(+)-dependent, decarboxylating) [Armatimonadota bacterium]|jgi:6-phosphogluconate dehydrogenase
MKIGMFGLGKMGANMALRLMSGGHEVSGWSRSEGTVNEAKELGVPATTDLEAAVAELETPRVLWLMVPAGDPVDDMIEKLIPLTEQGDIFIDGGNSRYSDALRRADELSARGYHLVDVGTSGGVWGLDEGYSMMIGGEDEVVEHLRPLFETLAPSPDTGWGHMGPTGAGHFVKMVHNGIEYGMMQAYAEGFALMRRKEQFSLDLHQIAETWRFGSVVRSWLLDLIARGLEQEGQELENIAPWVYDSGHGRWTVEEAIDTATNLPVISMALMQRFASRDEDQYANRLLAVMRNQFGGHEVKDAEDDGDGSQ